MMMGLWQRTDRMCYIIHVGMGAFLAVAVSLVVRESAVAWSYSVTGAVAMHDATFESIMFSYIGILCGIYNMGVFWHSCCRSLFEGVQFAWWRFVTGAVTMTTRHSKAFCSYILEDV